MPDRLLSNAASALVLLLLAAASTQAQQRYTFTTLLDSERDGLVPTRCAAINTLGVVAVTVSDQDGVTKIITKRGANDVPVVVADTQSVADFPTLCDNGFNNLPSDPSINEKGEVAFQGNLRRFSAPDRPDCDTPEQRERRQGVFVGRGGALTIIAHSINEPGGGFVSEFLVADQSITRRGVWRSFPSSTTRSTRDFSSARGVSLNELGQVAFESGLNDADISGIFLSNPDGTFRTVVDNTGGLSVGDPSLNILGRVAFTANRFDENFNQIFSIATSRGLHLRGERDPVQSRPGRLRDVPGRLHRAQPGSRQGAPGGRHL